MATAKDLESEISRISHEGFEDELQLVRYVKSIPESEHETFTQKNGLTPNAYRHQTLSEIQIRTLILRVQLLERTLVEIMLKDS